VLPAPPPHHPLLPCAIEIAQEVKETVNANRELVALGLSCLVGSFFQGHVVTGSFSRTAMNRDMGATSGVSGIVTACLMVRYDVCAPPFRVMEVGVCVSVLCVGNGVEG
jgi:SulP family sulfate permease